MQSHMSAFRWMPNISSIRCDILGCLRCSQSAFKVHTIFALPYLSSYVRNLNKSYMKRYGKHVLVLCENVLIEF
jgi:hypothetical protein